MAPEQTGRMNRATDSRADLYAFGVTLFELLTGRLPFLDTDILSIVHAHLAVRPPAPDTIDPTIPRPVSAIVMKLLAKAPEDRYQTADGVLADLQTCAARLRRDRHDRRLRARPRRRHQAVRAADQAVRPGRGARAC